MLALISPAKKLDFESDWLGDLYSLPALIEETETLADVAKTLSKADIQNLMQLSDKLTDLNYARFQNFSTPFTPANARPAIYAFRGDTYVGLDADTLDDQDMDFAQRHLCILSGLYGLLRPLDLIQPYRLEMGKKLHNPRGENLYDFWGDIITQACNDATAKHKNRSVICLASNEYIKSVKIDALQGDFITCHFKEIKDGAPKVIGLFAKRARGSMARYMIKHQIETPKELKNFNVNGYAFDPSSSDDHNYVFIRG
tara:strand:- start:848 stop:1615 length:768 start_codon:yes stop_codon:yes gene_type:complete